VYRKYSAWRIFTAVADGGTPLQEAWRRCHGRSHPETVAHIGDHAVATGVLAAGYAINQMLVFTDPARLAGLAEPAPWRAPGTRTAGLIQAGIARILREVGRSAFIAAIWGKIGAAASGISGSSVPLADKAT